MYSFLSAALKIRQNFLKKKSVYLFHKIHIPLPLLYKAV